MKPRWWNDSSTGPVWAALGVVTAGFALILLGWSLVAGRDDTGAQTAPLVFASGGGLLLVCVGALLMTRVVEWRDRAARARHLERLISVLEVEEDAA